MFPTFSPSPVPSPADRTRPLLALVLVLLLTLTTLAFHAPSPVGAALAPPNVNATLFPGSSNLVTLAGDGFTPGGRVQVVLVDHWGNALHTPVWVIAAPGGTFGDYGNYSGVSGYGDPGSIHAVVRVDVTAIHGPNGSQDPANGYHAGVDVGDLTDVGTIQVRALDEYANTWSGFAVVDVTPTLELKRGFPIHYDVPQRCVALIPCNLSY